MVDDEDFEEINKHKWYYISHRRRNGEDYGYAKRCHNRGKHLYMHNVLLNIANNSGIDHKDRGGLNNQKENLRRCSRSQNCANRNSIIKTSKFKGIYFCKNNKRPWAAELEFKGKRYRLGHFNTEEEAARKYDIYAYKFWGEFAYLNFRFPGEVSFSYE